MSKGGPENQRPEQQNFYFSEEEARFILGLLQMDQEHYDIFADENDSLISTLSDTLAQAYRKIKTVEDVKLFIHDEFVTHTDQYNILREYHGGDFTDSNGEVTIEIYRGIVELASTDGLTEDEKKVVLDWLKIWDTALLEYVCIESLYLTAIITGANSSVGWVIGSVISDELLSSPHLIRSTHFDRLHQTVQAHYDELLSGAISTIDQYSIVGVPDSEKSAFYYFRQEKILRMLALSQTKETKLPITFWLGLAENPELVRIIHIILFDIQHLVTDSDRAAWEAAKTKIESLLEEIEE